MNGITPGKTFTLGSYEATIILEDNKKIEQKFSIVEDKFPIPFHGILGIDFLINNKICWDFGKNSIIIPEENREEIYEKDKIENNKSEEIKEKCAEGKIEEHKCDEIKNEIDIINDKYEEIKKNEIKCENNNQNSGNKKNNMKDKKEIRKLSKVCKVIKKIYKKKKNYLMKRIKLKTENLKRKKMFTIKIEEQLISEEKEVIIKVKGKPNMTVICENKNLGGNLFIKNSLLTIDKNGIGYIGISNNTENYIKLKETKFKVEPINSYNTYVFNYNKKNDDRFIKLMDKIKLEHISQKEKQEFEILLENNTDIFYLEGDQLSFCDAIQHEIPINDRKPIFSKQYRLPMTQRKEINDQIQKMLTENIIRPSKSPWNSPVILVSKKSEDGNQKWRLVIDYRKLNEKSISDSFPLPNITEILDQLGGAEYFSTLDLASGYHQLLMKETDKEKTAFSTESNHYEFNRLPFGLKNAGRTFSRLMNYVLDGNIGKDCFVYLDDIVIYSKTVEEHNLKLSRIMNKLRQFNLKLHPEKCKFLKTQVVYLGHLITKEGIQPDPGKINCVENFPVPKNTKDIKSFLGLVGYYRKFIEGFAEIAKPLTKLLRKKSYFNWTEDCEQSFKKLKEILINPPLLQYPNFEETFNITTDASSFALGAILSQGKIPNDKPVAYAGRVLNEAETRYSTIEQEMLAIIWGVKHFRPYLFGKKFNIITDHKPLTWMFNIKDPSSRLMRWRIRLEEYHFDIYHKKGQLNTNVDALSRIQHFPEQNILITTRAKTLQQKEIINEIIENTWIQEIKFDKREENKINNKIHLLSLNDNIISDIEQNNNVMLKENDVYLKKKRLQNDFYLIVKDDITYDIDFNKFIITFEKMIKIAEMENIKELNIIKHNNYFENLNYEAIKSVISKILQEKEIKLKIYIQEIIKLQEKADIEKLINEYHSSYLGGHVGINRLENKIKQFYSFPKMKDEIAKIVLKCEKCQKNKYGKHTKMPMEVTTTSRKPFEKIALDIVGPLPESPTGNKYILTMIDDLTKYACAVPIINQEADTIARAFVNNFVLHHSIPEEILSDNGSNFVSELFKNTCKLLKIKNIYAAPYHPETNGALERTHRTLKEYLRIYVNENLNNWDVWIPFAIFTFNTTPHSSTGYSPHELVYGIKINLPTSLKNKPQAIYNYDNYYFELRYLLQKSHEIARQNQIRNKEKAKENYDTKLNKKQFKMGDKVLIQKLNIKGQGRKLNQLYDGPYEVTGIPSDVNTEINIKGKNKVFHNNILKKYIE